VEEPNKTIMSVTLCAMCIHSKEHGEAYLLSSLVFISTLSEFDVHKIKSSLGFPYVAKLYTHTYMHTSIYVFSSTQVPRLSAKKYQQMVGFIRVPSSKQPLDNTGVHPEQTQALEDAAKRAGMKLRDLVGQPKGLEAVRADEQLKKEVCGLFRIWKCLC
jgi:hypothetical protein